MPTFHFAGAVCALVACGILMTPCKTLAASPEPDEKKPTAQAAELQGNFKRAKDAEARRVAAEAMLALGEDGARRLHGIACSEYLARLPKYVASMRKAAGEVLGKRASTGDPTAEIAALRKTILDLTASESLSRESITKTSDPALQRLEELCTMTPAEIFAADPSLDASRVELLELAGWADDAAKVVPEKNRRKHPAIPDRDTVSKELDETAKAIAMEACPRTPADRQVLAANATLARDLDPEEASGISRLNTIRMLIGLPALLIEPKLVQACRVHSKDMVTHGFFGHDSPVAGRETPWSRAAAAGTSASAENIAGGHERGTDAIAAWWYSPGHHQNMLGKHTHTGLGRHELHWTQLFK